jgi:phage gp36-like protein
VADAALFTQAQLEARIGVDTARRCLDDDNDGTLDPTALAGLQRDAGNKVRRSLGPVYTVALLDPATLDALVTLSLDVAQAILAQRRPEYVRTDGYKLMQQAERDLSELRKGATNLGTDNPPEPAANQGGDVDSDDPNDTEPQPKVFLGGTGLF